MSVQGLLRLTVLMLVIILPWSAIHSFPVSHFKKESNLASGRWVKIEVGENGVYELTREELALMGFDNPAEVKVFGAGGHVLPESITLVGKDDVEQVPTMLTCDEKVCFYANGICDIDVVNYYSSPYFSITKNPYSSHGYYFVTDDERFTRLEPEVRQYAGSGGTEAVIESYAFCYHEQELVSPSQTGKNFLGEDITASRKYSCVMNMPNIVAGSEINLQVGIGADVTERTVVTAMIEGVDVDFISGTDILNVPADEYVFYDECQARGMVGPEDWSDAALLEIALECDGIVNEAFLDYYLATYRQNNVMPDGESQLRLDFEELSTSSEVVVRNVSDKMAVWQIDDAQHPVECRFAYDDSARELKFSHGRKTSWSTYVVFNPEQELKKISRFEHIPNQNLHALETPDYVIITTAGFEREAGRIADIHREKDGMDVAVVDQQLVFNEFSSGATDPTAIRMFLKMLYDRNPEKLKYLLLFGDGSYDNRKVGKEENLLVTFQSAISNDEKKSYTTDDYFAFLSDDSQTGFHTLPMCLSVGRMPVKSESEARNAVDKLLKYMESPAWGTWRNNALVIADSGDDGIHEYHAEGVAGLLENECMPRFTVTKIYSEAYPLSGGKAVAARTKLEETLEAGQLFMTFIGHGAPDVLTRVDLWRKADVKNLPLRFLPFGTFATCDVARFDSDERGIVEEMFHFPDGGIIAGVASGRTVYSDENDSLNVHVIRNLFTLDAGGNVRSIGEALTAAKNSLIKNASVNKLNFVLLGDPAMKLYYPKHRLRISSINGVSAEEVAVYPHTIMEVEGEVINEDGSTDTSFSGTVSVSLYDKKVHYGTLSAPTSGMDNREAYLSRELLSSGVGKVGSGRFSINVAIPENCLASDEYGEIRACAWNESTGDIFDGIVKNVLIRPFDASVAAEDVVPPVINAMYIDDESFCDGDVTGNSVILHVELSDDTGLNLQSMSASETVNLLLDNGIKSYPEIRNYYVPNIDGCGGHIEFPVSNLTEGLHEFTFSATDIAGNVSEKKISFFVVSDKSEIILGIDGDVVRDEAIFVIDMPETCLSPVVNLLVWGSNGEIVLNANVDHFPYTWNLIGDNGKRLSPGVYQFGGIVGDGKGVIVSAPGRMIVLEQ